jgi:hypothetical protein
VIASDMVSAHRAEQNLVLRVEEAGGATIMEAGLIMLRFGEEAAWFEANKVVLGELQAAV